jgi:hypothetical protein
VENKDRTAILLVLQKKLCKKKITTMNIQELLSTYGNLAYAIAIFFGGRWGLQYFSYFKETKYNFLVVATIFAAIFMIGEKAAGTFRNIDFIRYLITYAVVTSCYDMVGEWFPFLRPKQKDDSDKN